MFDIKWIRQNPIKFDDGLAKRKVAPQSQEIIKLDDKRRAAQSAAQTIQSERNALSKKIGNAKANKENPSELIAEVSKSKESQLMAEFKLSELETAINDRLSGIPNLPASDVPEGLDSDDNEEIRRVGEVPSFDFTPKYHFELGEALGLMDFETAGKIAGSRFVLLRGLLARLERSLGNFMLDLHIQNHGYEEISPPTLVNDKTMYGTGQLPKFGSDLFKTEQGYWLIPTAEVPLTNIVAGQIIDEGSLPRRYTALTSCFRSEAGAAGKDTRGMIRQHQFSKVEMVSITRTQDSEDELQRMIGCAEEVLKCLELPYRTVLLSTGDLGFGAQKTYDIEVWLPGENTYREISSCSNCGDFQARRMKARWRDGSKSDINYVHTLNGSGLAVGRTLIAIMENYQKADGSIMIPKVLWPLMDGVKMIG